MSSSLIEATIFMKCDWEVPSECQKPAQNRIFVKDFYADGLHLEMFRCNTHTDAVVRELNKNYGWSEILVEKLQ